MGVFPTLILKSTGTPGLLAEWLFSNNYLDTSGNGNNGTPTGTTFGPDRHSNANSALVLNGTSDFVDVGAGLPIGTNVRSFSFWFKTSSSSTQAMLGNRRGNSDGYIMFTSSTRLLFFNAKSSTRFDDVHNYQDGVWHHSVIIRAGLGNNKIYVDNVSQTLSLESENLDAVDDFLNTRIGVSVDLALSDYRFFDGSLDDIRIYDYALTPSEITVLFNE